MNSSSNSTSSYENNEESTRIETCSICLCLNKANICNYCYCLQCAECNGCTEYINASLESDIQNLKNKSEQDEINILRLTNMIIKTKQENGKLLIENSDLTEKLKNYIENEEARENNSNNTNLTIKLKTLENQLKEYKIELENKQRVEKKLIEDIKSLTSSFISNKQDNLDLVDINKKNFVEIANLQKTIVNLRNKINDLDKKLLRADKDKNEFKEELFSEFKSKLQIEKKLSLEILNLKEVLNIKQELLNVSEKKKLCAVCRFNFMI